jgi:hypothetical protein
VWRSRGRWARQTSRLDPTFVDETSTGMRDNGPNQRL